MKQLKHGKMYLEVSTLVIHVVERKIYGAWEKCSTESCAPLVLVLLLFLCTQISMQL